MANEPVKNPIQNEYAERLAADLAANRTEQSAVAEQLGVLQSRLEQLQAEEKWLSEMQGALPVSLGAGSASTKEGVAGSTGGAAEGAAVPSPRQAKAAGRSAAAKKSVKKATAVKKPAAAKPSSAKAPVAKAPVAKAPVAKPSAASTASRTPTLGELLEGILGKHTGQPFKVSEICTELKAAHPERATSDQVVRNALEGLVKKARIEKDNRQGVVLYTQPASGSGDAASKPVDEHTDAPAPAGV